MFKPLILNKTLIWRTARERIVRLEADNERLKEIVRMAADLQAEEFPFGWCHDTVQVLQQAAEKEA